MPTRTFSHGIAGTRTLDARPDRVDYRDLPYLASLRSLPDRFPDPKFIRRHFDHYGERWLLDQETEGACTGFGLAAVINYLLWKKMLEAESTVMLDDLREHELRRDAVWKVKSGFDPDKHQVSMRMLYQLARLYDEWPGEDYDGSSCRGAMKGWHRHGVCTRKLWKYEPGKFTRPKKGWETEAARCPLGAYYRISKDSLVDMQAAVYEVGAIYVSAYIHAGWFPEEGREAELIDDLPVLEIVDLNVGGHAFAIVGYNPVGFIVQNSWGPAWGNSGFAIMRYDDWIANGADAWVAVLGAPMEVEAGMRTRTSAKLSDHAGGKAVWSWSSQEIGGGFTYENAEVEPWREDRAYQHAVVLGNDGVPLNRFLDLERGEHALEEVAHKMPKAALGDLGPTPRIAVYAHGGLNDETVSIRRIRLLAPYFHANGIYPLFVTWRSGFLESIQGILGDAVGKIFPVHAGRFRRDWIDAAREQIDEAKDRTIEAAADQFLIKPIWEQMKQNAAAAAVDDRGAALLADHLERLKVELPGLEVHLVGHSAGAIVLGHLLTAIGDRFPVDTLSLYAPACTVPFAMRHYVPAFEEGRIGSAHFDLLSDTSERDDEVSVYGKSLLYLVSRALETVHKMPLLGMENAWRDMPAPEEVWHRDFVGDIAEWRAFAANAGLQAQVYGPGADAPEGAGDILAAGPTDTQVWDGQKRIPLNHGSFDNNVAVVTGTLERILGDALAFPVENLHGF